MQARDENFFRLIFVDGICENLKVWIKKMILIELRNEFYKVVFNFF